MQERLMEEFRPLFGSESAILPALMPGENEVVESLRVMAARLSQAAADLASTPSALTNALKEYGTPADLPSTPGALTNTLTAYWTPAEAAVTPAGVDTRPPRSSSQNRDSGPDAGSIATTVLESGFGLVPLVAGLVGLFTGGSDAPPPLEKYLMPSAISFASADVGRGLAAVDFDQMGAPRVYGAAVPPAAAPQNAPVAPQVTVNVQAIDAQSFLDYSSQIAQAVRGAMLNLSSLNDVVSEL